MGTLHQLNRAHPPQPRARTGREATAPIPSRPAPPPTVVSLTDKRAAGIRITDFQMRKARARREGDLEGVEFWQACIDGDIEAAQRAADRILYGPDGPDGDAA
jgi:hypothetical protein